MVFPGTFFFRRQFRLAYFEPLPLEFDEQSAEEELLLSEALPTPEPAARAGQGPALPTPGVLRESIERHLRRERPVHSGADAANELRNALAELRRSLG